MDQDARARRIQQSIELSLAYNSVGVNFVGAEEDPFPYHCIALTTSARTGVPFCLDPSNGDPRKIPAAPRLPVDGPSGSEPSTGATATSTASISSSAVRSALYYLDAFLDADRTMRPYTRVMALARVAEPAPRPSTAVPAEGNPEAEGAVERPAAPKNSASSDVPGTTEG